LEGHKHGVKSQMSKYKSSKSFKITCEWHGRTNQISINVACIYNTCTCLGILRMWKRWFVSLSGMEHTQKFVWSKCYKNPTKLSTIVGIFGRRHIPCPCYILLSVCCVWHQHDRLLNWMNVSMVRMIIVKARTMCDLSNKVV
jgi:hypothetical protein